MTARLKGTRLGIEFIGARITPIQIGIIGTSLGLLILVWYLMKFTKMGTAMRAVASDPELALVTGIDTDKTILFAFLLGSLLAGIAGLLISFDVDMTPTMGMNALMMGVVAVIVGGVGSIPGDALCGFLIAFARTALLVVEQEVKEVLEIADRVYALRLGKVVLEDTPSSLTQERIKGAFLGA